MSDGSPSPTDPPNPAAGSPAANWPIGRPNQGIGRQTRPGWIIPRRSEAAESRVAGTAIRLQGFRPLSTAPQGHGLRLGPHAGDGPCLCPGSRFRPGDGPPRLAWSHGSRQRHHGGGPPGGRPRALDGPEHLLPFEQDANPIIAGDTKLVHMKYFFTRKVMFVKECDAVVCLPGGFRHAGRGIGGADPAADRKTRHGSRWCCWTVPAGTTGRHFTDSSSTTCLQDGMISAQDLSIYCLTDDCTRRSTRS